MLLQVSIGLTGPISMNLVVTLLSPLSRMFRNVIGSNVISFMSGKSRQGSEQINLVQIFLVLHFPFRSRSF